MSKAVLFDLDGVLVATEDLKAIAHSQTVARYGGHLVPAFYGHVMGQSHPAANKAFTEASGVDIDPQDYERTFRSIYGELIGEGVSQLLGASALLEELGQQGYQLAVVSSSLRWMMDEVLARAGLTGFFQVSISADDVQEEKPSPEPYLLALAELSLDPGDAVVVEDSEAGVASAVNAGIEVVALRHKYNGEHDFSGAYVVLDGIHDTRRVIEVLRSAVGRDPTADRGQPTADS